jgi:TonB-dependent SusC/RagA subfamily outer membrane receptor
LKDASGTAIYGSRGANGVIFITTKKGKAGVADELCNQALVSHRWQENCRINCSRVPHEVPKLGGALDNGGAVQTGRM